MTPQGAHLNENIFTVCTFEFKCFHPVNIKLNWTNFIFNWKYTQYSTACTFRWKYNWSVQCSHPTEHTDHLWLEMCTVCLAYSGFRVWTEEVWTGWVQKSKVKFIGIFLWRICRQTQCWRLQAAPIMSVFPKSWLWPTITCMRNVDACKCPNFPISKFLCLYY